MEENQQEFKKEYAKWYVITTINGNEDSVYKNIYDRVRGYNLEDAVLELRVLKTKEITIEVFDPIKNPPPSRMINTNKIKWETLPHGRFKKTITREVSLFPGYIYIKMFMNEHAWYVIRNTDGVTGFVGSSGKGAKPVPMSDYEVDKLFDPKNIKEIVINKTEGVYFEPSVDNANLSKEVKFVADNEGMFVDQDGFYNSQLNQNNTQLEEQLTKLEQQMNYQHNDKKQTRVVKELLDNPFATKEELLQELDTNTENIFIDENKEEISDISLETDQNKMVDFYEAGSYEKKLKPFLIGDEVVILSGDMKDHIGKVIEIDEELHQIKVVIDIFGRENNVILDYEDVRKNN